MASHAESSCIGRQNHDAPNVPVRSRARLQGQCMARPWCVTLGCASDGLSLHQPDMHSGWQLSIFAPLDLLVIHIATHSLCWALASRGPQWNARGSFHGTTVCSAGGRRRCGKRARRRPQRPGLRCHARGLGLAACEDLLAPRPNLHLAASQRRAHPPESPTCGELPFPDHTCRGNTCIQRVAFQKAASSHSK